MIGPRETIMVQSFLKIHKQVRSEEFDITAQVVVNGEKLPG
jgi:hypothetical protein